MYVEQVEQGESDFISGLKLRARKILIPNRSLLLSEAANEQWPKDRSQPVMSHRCQPADKSDHSLICTIFSLRSHSLG
jgi:hypothetical protein